MGLVLDGVVMDDTCNILDVTSLSNIVTADHKQPRNSVLRVRTLGWMI